MRKFASSLRKSVCAEMHAEGREKRISVILRHTFNLTVLRVIRELGAAAGSVKSRDVNAKE